MRTHKGNNQTPRLHLCACHSFLMSRLWALSWGCLEGMCPEAHRRHQGPCPLTSCRELSNLGSPPRGGGEGEWDPTKCALAMRIAASERGTCGVGHQELRPAVLVVLPLHLERVRKVPGPA